MEGQYNLSEELELIEKNRNALLLAQAGALLHNLGKVTRQFFEKEIYGLSPEFRYQHILHLIEDDFPGLENNILELYNALQQEENKNVLDAKTIDSLKKKFNLPSPFDDRVYRPGDMIEYLGQGKIDKKYLFSWDEVQGNDSEGLIEFLAQKFGIDWVKTVKIEKIDDNRTIKISNEKNYISLKLDEKKKEVNIEIDDGRTDKFIVKKEKDTLNIYENSKKLNIYKERNLYEDNIISAIFKDGSRLTHLMNRAHRGASGGEKHQISIGRTEGYLFSWDEIPGNDIGRLIDFLKQKYSIDWVKTAEIEKIDDSRTIRLSYKGNFLSLKLNDEKTKVNLKIDDGRTDEFIVMTEKGKLNIYRDFFKSTPFGWEPLRLDLKDVDDAKAHIERIIKKHLNLEKKSLDFEKFSKELHPYLEKNIADSQRPINDITIWDMGDSGMAFFLTQAIEKIVNNKSIDHMELGKLEENNSLFWRVLSFRLDGLNYLDGAPSLADARVRLNLLHQALENIRKILEGLPVAIEVYRDENGSFYIYPDLPKGHPFTQALMNSLDSNLLVDGISLPFCLSSEKLVNHPLDEGGMYVGKYITDQINKEIPKVYDLKTYTDSWKSDRKELCVACGVRPQGYGANLINDYEVNPKFYSDKAKSRDICCICMDRRSGVSEKWTENLNKDTVWIDEVSDIHGRVALIAGQFDMHYWNMSYPESFCQYFEVENVKDGTPPTNGEKLYGFEYDEKRKIFVKNSPKQEELPKYKENNDSIDKFKINSIERLNNKYKIILCEAHNIQPRNEYSFRNINFSSYDDRTLITVDEKDAKKVEDIYLHGNKYVIARYRHYYNIQESQSFARIRRVWETTKHFWDDVSNFPNINKDGPRLEIRGDLSPRINTDKPGRYHVYNLLLGKIKLSVVWDEKNNRFITAHNLEYISQPNRLKKDVKDWLKKGDRVSIEEPTGYGSKNKDWGSITIEEIIDIKDSKYNPAIKILSEPRTFMAFVPANKALDIINGIKEKYELEMGKVRNRLPLHLGIIFASNRTPFRVIMDAGRRILESKSNSCEEWVVKKTESETSSVPEALKKNDHFKNVLTLHLEQKDKKAIWHVPLMMGDGEIKDKWYPYVFLPCDKNSNKHDDRKFSFEYAPKWPLNDIDKTQNAWFVHVNDLKEKDIINFTPSTLDFHWMDTSGSRFEIVYEETGRRIDKPHIPYLLDDLVKIQNIWETLSRHLNSTQILAIHELIEAKRSDWDYSEVFRKFCFNIIANVEWKKYQDKKGEKKYPWEISNQQKMDFLCEYTDYAATGLLGDVIFLYLKILKEKPEREREESK